MKEQEYSDIVGSIGSKAKAAARALSAADTAAKNAALEKLACLLEERKDSIFEANALDLERAEKRGLDAPRLDRLRITPAILSEMAGACRHVAGLPDPIGALDSEWTVPSGIRVGRMRIPLGVIAMIYEARPNVTTDASILCLKAGNAVILRGGSEALGSNTILASLVREALVFAGLPADAVQLVPFTDRIGITLLCKLGGLVDVIIPRGGEPLIKAVSEQAVMPVLKHDKGVTHAFIDESADLGKAVIVVDNSKNQRPAACNALEGLLVHSAVAERFLPMVAARLTKTRFKACPRSLPLLGANAEPQTDADRGTEFHDYTLAVTVVDSLDEALDYIALYGSNHTEIICTENVTNAERFLREADASMVAVNASSRFNDGGQLGLGAEIGISTSKLHAYGPMGLRELTTTKFVVRGSGQVRA